MNELGLLLVGLLVEGVFFLVLQTFVNWLFERKGK